MTYQQNITNLSNAVDKITKTQQKNILEYTQKQKWLEWLRYEIIQQCSNSVDIGTFENKNAIIKHVYVQHVNEKMYSEQYTLAFLNEKYYKIAHEIMSVNQKENAKRTQQELKYKKQMEQIEDIKLKLYAKIICLLLIIPFFILYTIFL